MAKDPNNRPFDAEAVAEVLRKLAAVAERNETLPMVFGGDGNPTRLGTIPPNLAAGVAPTAAGGPESTQGRKATRSTRRRDRASASDGWNPPRWLGTAVLVAAGLVVASLIVYLLLPPGARTLMAEAEEQMASKEMGRWIAAQRDLFDAIERKVPDPEHPYRRKVRAWREQIALERARRRSEILDRPNLTKVSQPNPDIRGEQLYVVASKGAEAALEAGRDESAALRWEEMASALRRDDPAERPWATLAGERAAQVRKEMNERESLVRRLLDEADRADRIGEPAEADKIRRDVRERYGKKAHLQYLLHSRGAASSEPVREGEKAETPEPKP